MYSYNNDLIAPQPSGHAGKILKTRASLCDQVNHVTTSYDKMHFEQADFRNPAFLEVVTRQRHFELQKTNDELKLQKETLKIEQGEISEQLKTMEHDLTIIKDQNKSLNETVRDHQFGITSTFADETFGIDLQTHERATFAQMKDNIDAQQRKLEFSMRMRESLQEDFYHRDKISQKKLESLKIKMDLAAELLEERDQEIHEKINLNKTIVEEKNEFAILKDEYQEKVLEYKNELVKSEAQKTMQIADFQEKMGCLTTEISKRSERISYWRAQTEKRDQEYSEKSKELNNERAKRVRCARQEKTTRVSMEKLTRKSQKTEAVREILFRDNGQLREELTASRAQLRDYERMEERKRQSFAKKMVGKLLCGGNY